MSSHNKKNIASSHNVRSRALTTFNPRFSDTTAQRSSGDRVGKARPHTNLSSQRFSQREQQAILDAAVASGAFEIPAYYPIPSPARSIGEASIDPSNLTLSPANTAVTHLSALPSISVDQVSLVPSTVQGQLEHKDFPLEAGAGQNMSATTYMLPPFAHGMDPHYAHYSAHYQPTSAGYAQDTQQQQQRLPHSSPPTSTYATSYTTSPALMSTSPSISHAPQDQELRSHVHREQYAGSYHSAAASPYLPSASSPAQTHYGFAPSPATHMQFPHSQSPGLGGHDVAAAAAAAAAAAVAYPPPYNTIPSSHYPSTSYDTSHSSVPAGAYVPGSTGAWPPQASGFVGSSTEAAGAAGSSSSAVLGTSADSGVRILNSRPKPQCWDHGCNGRQFSTFSNLLRHQREKSGTAAKSVCPRCGAEFTRTTARNGHMAHDKCKRRSLTGGTTSGADP